MSKQAALVSINRCWSTSRQVYQKPKAVWIVVLLVDEFDHKAGDVVTWATTKAAARAAADKTVWGPHYIAKLVPDKSMRFTKPIETVDARSVIIAGLKDLHQSL